MYDVAITILTYYADLLTRPQEQTIHPACRYTGSKPIDKARGPWTPVQSFFTQDLLAKRDQGR